MFNPAKLIIRPATIRDIDLNGKTYLIDKEDNEVSSIDVYGQLYVYSKKAKVLNLS